METIWAQAFQVAEAIRAHALQGASDAASVEVKLEVRLAELRLTMQEMAEQLTAL